MKQTIVFILILSLFCPLVSFADLGQSGQGMSYDFSTYTDAELQELKLQIDIELKHRKERLAVPSSVSDFEYVTNGSVVQINKYVGKGGDVVIPNEIDGMPVTRIGAEAFAYTSSITSITLPDSLEFIDEFAFMSMQNLSGIIILPANVLHVGSSAFGFTNISGLVILGDSNLIFGTVQCNNLMEFVYVADGASPIFGKKICHSCQQLQTVILPSSISILDATAFSESINVTIYTPATSKAEQYAKENFIRCNTEKYDEMANYYASLYGGGNSTAVPSVVTPTPTAQPTPTASPTPTATPKPTATASKYEWPTRDNGYAFPQFKFGQYNTIVRLSVPNGSTLAGIAIDDLLASEDGITFNFHTPVTKAAAKNEFDKVEKELEKKYEYCMRPEGRGRKRVSLDMLDALVSLGGGKSEFVSYSYYYDKELSLQIEHYLHYTNGEYGHYIDYSISNVVEWEKKLSDLASALLEESDATPTQKPIATTTPVAQTEKKYETLKPGIEGQAVLDARIRLYELGYFSKVPTQTEYTNNMMDYVKRFEKDYGLTVDGVLSPDDQAVLFGSHEEYTSPYRMLKPGDNSQAVLDARMRLYEWGYFMKVPTQTEYTKNMMDYVKHFEKDYGLEQDGILSVEDQEVLFGTGNTKNATEENKAEKTTSSHVSPEAVYPKLKKGTVVSVTGREIKVKSASFQQKYTHEYWDNSGRKQRVNFACQDGFTQLVIKFDLTNTSGTRMSAEKVIYVQAKFDGIQYGGYGFPTDYQSSIPSFYPMSNEYVWSGETKELVFFIDVPSSKKNAKEITIEFLDGITYDVLGVYYYK